jgi:hypothetical protein
VSSRIIRESCRTSESLDALSDFAERLFWRLTTFADDHGRFNAHPRIVLAGCFPLRIHQLTEQQIDEALAEMQQADMLTVYSNGGKRLAEFTNWNAHQRLRSTDSKFAGPADPESAPINLGKMVCGKLPQLAANCGEPPQDAADCGVLRASADALHNPPDLNSPDPESSLLSKSLQEPRVSEDVALPKRLVLSGAVKAAKRMRSQMRENFELTPERIKQAMEAGLSELVKIKFEFVKFRDHFLGSGALKVDWDATWRNWCRDAAGGGRFASRVSAAPSRDPPAKEYLSVDEIRRQQREEMARHG